MKVFISYPSQSKGAMLELTDQLRREGGFDSIWRDDDHIKPGAIISDVLQSGFRESDCCVLLLTKHTEKSAWCMQEVGAFWGANKPIIVYCTDGAVRVPALFAGKRTASNFDEIVRALRDVQPVRPLVKNVFTNSGDGHFRQYLEGLARQAKNIRLIGTGLQILNDAEFTKDILRRAAEGECSLEIYLGDPYSPAVEARLIEENLGDPVPVPVGKDGMIIRAHTLAAQWERYRFPKPEFGVKLFTHYPTFALLIFDDDYFFYPYGCARIGDFSPVFQLSGGVPEWNDIIEFFEAQYVRVKQSSTMLARLASHGKVRTDPVKFRTKLDVSSLWTFGLFYVPPLGSALYQFGSQVLGYDVRERGELGSKWAKSVGDGTKAFGFHLTLCDALYFLTEGELENAINEAEFVASEFEEFELSDLQLEERFPDQRSISLVPRDPTGTLEALHHEFVHRIYRRATASNYTLGLAKPTRDSDPERANLMIEKYLAPYILNRFRPHFTLLTNVPPRKQREIHEKLRQEFNKKVGKITLRVEALAVMSRPEHPSEKEPNPPWMINREIELKTRHASTSRTRHPAL